MSFDAAYSYLIDLTWFFLGGWVLLLVMAYVLAFIADELPETVRNTR